MIAILLQSCITDRQKTDNTRTEENTETLVHHTYKNQWRSFEFLLTFFYRSSFVNVL